MLVVSAVPLALADALDDALDDVLDDVPPGGVAVELQPTNPTAVATAAADRASPASLNELAVPLARIAFPSKVEPG